MPWSFRVICMIWMIAYMREVSRDHRELAQVRDSTKGASINVLGEAPAEEGTGREEGARTNQEQLES